MVEPFVAIFYPVTMVDIKNGTTGSDAGTLEVKGIRVIEYLLAIFMILAVLWGLVMLVMAMPWLEIPEDPTSLHHAIEKLMSDIILLVVGLELAMLLVHRKIEFLVDIVLFVIARKMLLTNSSAPEMLMGVAAIAGLYAVRKYLLICPGCQTVPFKNFLGGKKE